MIRWKTLLSTLYLGAAFAMPAGAQNAGDVAAFYKGKTMRVIVGYAPGGGYDVYARLLAENLPRYLPGNPLITVQYMPGAATEVATAYILNAAPQDGTVIGIPVSGLPMSTLIFRKPGENGIDIANMRWIGRLDVIDTVAVVWNTVPVKNMDEAKARGLVFGATAPNSSSYMVPIILNRIGKGNFKIVNGYRGTTEAYLAMERGEIEGMHNAVWSQVKRTRAAWIKENKVTPLYQQSGTRSADLPHVPSVVELADTEDDRRVFRLMASEATLGRTFYVSNGVPKERIAALRAAFTAMVQDKAFLETAEKLDTPINPLSGDEIEKIVSEFSSYPPEVFERIRKLTAP